MPCSSEQKNSLSTPQNESFFLLLFSPDLLGAWSVGISVEKNGQDKRHGGGGGGAKEKSKIG